MGQLKMIGRRGKILWLLSFLAVFIYQVNSQTACNCVDCKNILEGPYPGTYVSMGDSSETGGCLYRDYTTRLIIRACDTGTFNKYKYVECSSTAPTQCIDPPTFSDFGYDSVSWDGSKLLVAKATFYCAPPKTIVGYNGTAYYDIHCAAQFFPYWQGWLNSLISTSLPVCQQE